MASPSRSRRAAPPSPDLPRRLEQLLEPQQPTAAHPDAGRHRRSGEQDGDVEVLSLPPRPVWTRATLAVVAAVALVAIAVSVVMLLNARARVVPVGAPARTTHPVAALATSGAPSSALAGMPGAPSSASGPVVVDVAGLVRHPGVVTLPPGSRAADAVAAAGGVRRGADLSLLNLARRLSDGEQVLVPASGAPRPPEGAGGPGGGTSAGPVNLNSATADQLDGLPGIGPVLAQRIVSWREQHGRFAAVDELQEVSGIGDRLYAQLQPLVTV